MKCDLGMFELDLTGDLERYTLGPIDSNSRCDKSKQDRANAGRHLELKWNQPKETTDVI